MAKTVIIGGGAIGLSLAWNLARRGRAATLLERGALTSGTSWHAAGIVGPLRASLGMTRIAMAALSQFPLLEEETGLSTGFRRTGGWWLAREAARLDELHRIAAIGRAVGLECGVATTIDAPGVDAGGVIGALRVEDDAAVNPVDLCMAYAAAARRGGADIREGARVTSIITQGDAVAGVRLASGAEIEADQVAICAGAWSKALTDPLGVALPLQPVEHMYVVTEPAGLSPGFPVLRDLDRGIYVKDDAGKLVIGGFEPDAKLWDARGPEADRPFLELPEDWDQFAPFMEAALALIPALADLGIRRFMNGPESFTNDGRPLVGAAPGIDGLFVAAGMNSVGVMSSAGIGGALAEWMIEGRAQGDLWEIDIARADPRASSRGHMEERMREAVADTFAIHWPFRQPKAGRGLRRSALHDRWSAAGAVFGLTAGWERGLWYARTAEEREPPYSVGRQHWADIAAREARAMATGAAMLDLSPFAKFDIAGPQALVAAQRVFAPDLDIAVGRAVYAPALNDDGGIEIDATVTRMGEAAFRVTGGAATRWRDFAFLRRALAPFDAVLADRTEDEAVIGLMGPESRGVLTAVADGFADHPYGTARTIRIGGVGTMATRLSFVGELGWELSVPAAAAAVYDALAAHAPPLGHYALDGCRVEKGFAHWGHDIGPTVTPPEAGLGFALGWGTGFRGEAALGRRRRAGPARRLVLFELEGAPLVLHDEPIREGGRLVGFTTSGALGPRTGLTLAFGMVGVAPGETKADTARRSFHIGIAGRDHAARALSAPPYDPKGERMRA